MELSEFGKSTPIIYFIIALIFAAPVTFYGICSLFSKDKIYNLLTVTFGGWLSIVLIFTILLKIKG